MNCACIKQCCLHWPYNDASLSPSPPVSALISEEHVHVLSVSVIKDLVIHFCWIHIPPTRNFFQNLYDFPKEETNKCPVSSTLHFLAYHKAHFMVKKMILIEILLDQMIYCVFYSRE